MSKAPTGMGHHHNKEQQHPHWQWPTSIAPVAGVLPLLEEWRHNATQELTHKCSHHVFLPTTTSRCNKKHTVGANNDSTQDWISIDVFFRTRNSIQFSTKPKLTYCSYCIGHMVTTVISVPNVMVYILVHLHLCTIFTGTSSGIRTDDYSLFTDICTDLRPPGWNPGESKARRKAFARSSMISSF